MAKANFSWTLGKTGNARNGQGQDGLASNSGRGEAGKERVWTFLSPTHRRRVGRKRVLGFVQASNSGEESGGREVFEPLPPRKAQGAEGGSGIIKDRYFTGSRTERKPRGLWESC